MDNAGTRRDRAGGADHRQVVGQPVQFAPGAGGVGGGGPLRVLVEGQPTLGRRLAEQLDYLLALGVGDPDPVGVVVRLQVHGRRA